MPLFWEGWSNIWRILDCDGAVGSITDEIETKRSVCTSVPYPARYSYPLADDTFDWNDDKKTVLFSPAFLHLRQTANARNMLKNYCPKENRSLKYSVHFSWISSNAQYIRSKQNTKWNAGICSCCWSNLSVVELIFGLALVGWCRVLCSSIY